MAHTETIGRYRVLGTLGQGAMGRVYLAYDPGFGIQVAVKLIKRDNMLENQVILSRFKREAALGARMRHPNIVAIYDVGHDVLHGPYMVMEYVDGKELLEILESGSPTRSEILDWLGQIARALDCSHRVGVVHRDVKPANVLVAQDGKAKLIDFGVAKVIGDIVRLRPGENLDDLEDPADDLLQEKHATAWGLLSAREGTVHDGVHIEVLSTHGSGAPAALDSGGDSPHRSEAHLTQMGTLIGTPAYTAPELLRGGTPSPATDHFALAVTAFQMLLGRLPFRGLDTLDRIRVGAIDFPPDTDPRLVDVFRKALAPDPGDRFPDLDHFLEALHQACDLPRPQEEPAAPIRPARATGPMPLVAPPSDHALLWIKLLGGALALILLAGLALKWWLAPGTALDEISVNTIPHGASIYVDGLYLGQSPLDRITLPADAHNLRVLKKGYESVERHLTARDSYVSLILERSPYDLNVETQPPGAEVWLDGRREGTSPVLLKRIPGKGEHILELRLEGHLTSRIPLDPSRPPRPPFLLAPEEARPR